MARGVSVPTITDRALLLKAPDGTEYPFAVSNVDATDPNAVTGSAIAPEINYGEWANGTWKVCSTGVDANKIMDLDGVGVALTVLDEFDVSIIPSPTNQPPVIVKTSADQADISAAGMQTISFSFTVSDPA